jgi:hypothetical protein
VSSKLTQTPEPPSDYVGDWHKARIVDVLDGRLESTQARFTPEHIAAKRAIVLLADPGPKKIKRFEVSIWFPRVNWYFTCSYST